MRIVIPVASLHLGGGCKLLAETANRLHQRGHKVIVSIPEGKPIDFDLKCEVVRMPTLDASFIPDGDVILPNYYTTVMPSFTAFPTKCMRLSLGYEPMWSNDKEGTLKTYALPIPIFSISQWHHDLILKETEKHSMVINPGIDHSIFKPNEKNHTSNKTKKILFLARDPNLNYGFKGITDFTNAMMIVKQKTKIPFIIHLLCPEGEHHLTGLPVQIFGPTNDNGMVKHYHESDIFVSASWFESFGYPVLEAMACGTTVVTTDSGGVRDFAINNKTCLMCPPKQPNALAEAILFALKPANEKKLSIMKSHAQQKSLEFTWERYITQLESALNQFNQNSVIIKSEYIDNLHLKNYELGKLMSKMECWPHGVDLLANKSFKQIIKDGAQQTLEEDKPLSTLSVLKIEQKIKNARKNNTGLSIISIGDTESAFLSINPAVVEPYFSLPKKGFINAGYDPNRKAIEQMELFQAIKHSDIVGLPLFRHGLIRKPLLHYLSKKGINLDKIEWSDSTLSYQLLYFGLFNDLLKDDSKVSCIGNEAKRLARFLQNQKINVVGIIDSVNGFKDWKRVVSIAQKIPHNIALVAAGAASIPICSHLAKTKPVIAIDLGKVADEWVIGVSQLNGSRDIEKMLTREHFTQHQKNFSLEFQTGYQHGLNECVSKEQAYPINTLPINWIKRYMQSVQSNTTHKDSLIRSPVWLLQKIKDAYNKSEPLSVVNFGHRAIDLLSLPGFQLKPEIQTLATQLDVLGIPFLMDQSSANRYMQKLQPFKPKIGWIDETTLKQLQFDYYGKFLPLWLKGKKILLIMRNPDSASQFLQENGYTIWGSINTAMGPKRVFKELAQVKRFEIALVSAELTNTIEYSHFITEKTGKIALDIGDIFHDITSGGISRIYWKGLQVHKID
jgi:glycosyltransferase involved in cell wall biosynthesis